MINTPRPRCSTGLNYEGKQTRCYLPAGHGGPHRGKDKKNNPYVTIRWFDRDARSFLTSRVNEWAWIPKGKKGDEMGEVDTNG